MLTDIANENPHAAIADYDLAKKVAESLHKHYPDHLWAVTVEHDKGIATVRNLRLSGQWGFIFGIDELEGDPGMKKVMRAGGELLERYQLHVGRYDEDEYSQLHADFAGRFKADT